EGGHQGHDDDGGAIERSIMVGCRWRVAGCYNRQPPTNNQQHTRCDMSKKVKNLITQETADRLKDIDAVAVISPRGINAIKNNQIRRKLREKGLRMTVVKNTLAKRAIGADSKLKGFDTLLDGPSAVIYGKASIATIA